MWVGLIRAELRIPGARSLKAKRRPLKSLLARLETRHHVAVAEVDAQNLHQRAVVGVACVGSDPRHLRRRLQAVRAALEGQAEAQVLSLREEVFREASVRGLDAAFASPDDAGEKTPEGEEEGYSSDALWDLLPPTE